MPYAVPTAIRLAKPNHKLPYALSTSKKRRDIYTITRAAAINEYLLAMTVKAQAFRNSEPVGEPMEVKVHRTMDYADSEVLGKQEEEETIWSEMRIDAADQIVRRLTFLKAQ